MEKDSPDRDTDSIPEYEGINSKYVIYIICAVTVLMVLMVLITGIQPVTFAVYDTTKTDYYLNNLEEAKAVYNQDAERLPGLFLVIFGDERIDATLIRLSSEKVQLAVVTDNGRIVDIQKGASADPTMTLEMSESTIKRISESDNAVDELETALDNEEIKYHTIQPKSTVKMAIMEAAIQVWSWFS